MGSKNTIIFDPLLGKAFLKALSQLFILVAAILAGWAMSSISSTGLSFRYLIYVVLIAVLLVLSGLVSVASEIVKKKNMR